MEGILLSLDRQNRTGIVDTRNDRLGSLRIYFSFVPEGLQENSSVEFDVCTSAIGNHYAKFKSIVDRNTAIFNTEDRSKWYDWGVDQEADFIRYIVPQIGRDIQTNPAKTTRPWEIDLYDFTENKYADLKTQNTPFFYAGKYHYKGIPYDPAYSVTFNKKDYEKYSAEHPDCDIYFWVHWKQTAYRNVSVPEIYGVWRAHFPDMAYKIQNGEVALHSYLHRTDDDHNAKESYIFFLNDPEIFERLI